MHAGRPPTYPGSMTRHRVSQGRRAARIRAWVCVLCPCAEASPSWCTGKATPCVHARQALTRPHQTFGQWGDRVAQVARGVILQGDEDGWGAPAVARQRGVRLGLQVGKS